MAAGSPDPVLMITDYSIFQTAKQPSPLATVTRLNFAAPNSPHASSPEQQSSPSFIQSTATSTSSLVPHAASQPDLPQQDASPISSIARSANFSQPNADDTTLQYLYPQHRFKCSHPGCEWVGGSDRSLK